MSIFINILLLMLLLHVIDDFVLQPTCLSKLKQKKTWDEYCEGKSNYIKNLYKNDYKAAIVVHALSWSIMIMLPWIFLYGEKIGITILSAVIINTIIHGFIDNEKANKERINLWQDQLVHFFQILLTWVICIDSITVYNQHNIL